MTRETIETLILQVLRQTAETQVSEVPEGIAIVQTNGPHFLIRTYEVHFAAKRPGIEPLKGWVLHD